MVLEIALNEKREGVPLVAFPLEMRKDIKNKDHSPEGQ